MLLVIKCNIMFCEINVQLSSCSVFCAPSADIPCSLSWPCCLRSVSSRRWAPTASPRPASMWTSRTLSAVRRRRENPSSARTLSSTTWWESRGWKSSHFCLLFLSLHRLRPINHPNCFKGELHIESWQHEQTCLKRREQNITASFHSSDSIICWTVSSKDLYFGLSTWAGNWKTVLDLRYLTKPKQECEVFHKEIQNGTSHT